MNLELTVTPRRHEDTKRNGLADFESSRLRGVIPAGFTLVELLVVISIMGLLASLILGVGGIASRKSKESRITAERDRLITLIENYKARVGFYPPSNEGPLQLSSGLLRPPQPSQLYYELSGSVFVNPGRFFSLRSDVQNVAEGFDTPTILSVFNVDGFANSARERRNVRVKNEFKPDQVKKLAVSGRFVDVLVAPLPPPASPAPEGPLTLTTTSGRYYPWFYDSISTNRYNADGFDLWTEVQIGKKFVRFSNWEPGPVTIGP